MNQNHRFAIDRTGTHRARANRAGALGLLAVAHLLLLTLPASAGDPLHNLFGCPGPVPDCIGRWCPDDYCAKKAPCVSVPLCFGCDDYCSKQASCVSVPLCFTCDDYCPKCPPKVCNGLLCQNLQCGVSGQSCSCANCDTLPCDGYVANQAETNQQVETAEKSPGKNDESLVNEQSPAKAQRLPPVYVGASGFKLTK
jgi:hypothetical protein